MIIGEIKSGRNSYIWQACVDCGKERWVRLQRGEARSSGCLSCALKRRNGRGSGNPGWKGGRTKNNGYMIIWLYPSDFFYSMADVNGYVLEHRLVMAKHLGRNLHRWEIVHHKNGIRDDNRIENLQLVSDDRHKQITLLETRIKHLETRVTLLEIENIRLETQLGGTAAGEGRRERQEVV